MADDPAPSQAPAAPADLTALGFSPDQIAWLKNHPLIRVGLDPAWPPFSYYSREGVLVGIDPDMLRLLEKRLGVKFVEVSGKNWAEVYAMGQTHQVDMFAGLAETPERLAVLDFTESYIEFPVGLITRDDAPFMIDLPSLAGHTVAAPRDYAATIFLQHDYPKTHLVFTETVTDALTMVSRGNAFATLDNLASVNYIIKDRGLGNLKVAGITNYQFALRYGVRKDWPELVPILHQALASITDREREEIKDRWININVDKMVADESHERMLLVCLAIAAVSILLVLIWNWTLDREIRLRKKAEIELREARNRAVDASRMKSVFLANLSHEIRNPLHAMLGFTELLKLGTADARLQRYVDAIDAGGRTLLGVINDVLDLSKVEAGRLEIHPAPVDVGHVVRETHALFAPRAAQKGIDYTCEIDPALPSCVSFDELRLRQILYNCVSNAIKFTPHGSVCLRVFVRPNPQSSEENTLLFEISDTGNGIPASEHARIFEPFAQREGQSSHLGGTGLGLSISKRLTELMGGHIELESEPGKGTTFRFVFPRLRTASFEPPAAVAKADGLAGFKPLKVLVIDDVESNRELIREYFERAGHVVWEAGAAEEGIVSAQTHLPDVALLDYHLPDMSGGQAAIRLKADPRTCDMPVIFISGSMMLDIEDLAGGKAVVLAKPLVHADLVNAIRLLLPNAIKSGFN